MNKTKTTNWFKRGIVMVAAFAAIAVFSSPQADAQVYFGSGRGISIGSYGHGGSFNLNVGRGYGGGVYGGGIHAGHGAHGYSRGYSGFNGYNNFRRPTFHNTTHLDYHGPSLQRHGNHFDIVPGHYDVHRTGHWHR